MSGGSSNKQVPETPEEKALAGVAAERYLRYKQAFVPIENKAINLVENRDLGPLVAGMANVGTQASFSRGEASLGAGLENRGLRVGSPGFGMNLAAYNLNRTESSGIGAANAYGITAGQKLNNLQSLVAMGQGQAGASLQGQEEATGLASRQAIIDTQAALAARGAIGGGLGTAAGLAFGNSSFNNAYATNPNGSAG